MGLETNNSFYSVYPSYTLTINDDPASYVLAGGCALRPWLLRQGGTEDPLTLEYNLA